MASVLAQLRILKIVWACSRGNDTWQLHKPMVAARLSMMAAYGTNGHDCKSTLDTKTTADFDLQNLMLIILLLCSTNLDYSGYELV